MRDADTHRAAELLAETLHFCLTAAPSPQTGGQTGSGRDTLQGLLSLTGSTQFIHLFCFNNDFIKRTLI